jgi:plastocyanin
VREFLRLALPALLGASLGCVRQSPAGADAGQASPKGAGAQLEHPFSASDASVASVEGRVLWLGPRPASSALATNPSVQSVCGPSVTDNAFQLDAQGGVVDAVVWVDAPAVPLPLDEPTQEVVLDQRRCLYLPAVLAARAGGTLRLRNSDPLTHTVHALWQAQTLFDVAMPLQHAELTRTLPAEPGVLDVRCDVHPWMHATVRTFSHPHFTSTDAGGRFRLPGLLPGEATVHAWHPRLGEASKRVRLSAGATRTDFDFGGKQP